MAAGSQEHTHGRKYDLQQVERHVETLLLCGHIQTLMISKTRFVLADITK